MPKCKNCKGEGFVHPMITMECNMCYNNDEGKKKLKLFKNPIFNYSARKVLVYKFNY